MAYRIRWLTVLLIVLLPLAAVRAQTAVKDNRRSLPEGVMVQRDIPYVTGGGNAQSLDLYLPATPSPAPLPLVLWVHGGGWEGGDKNNPPGVLLVTRGFALASINYRLSRQATFPAQLQDCKAAVRFLRAKAAEYRLDPERFGAWGGSAGGHLVALLGTTGEQKAFDVGEHADVSSRVQAVCDWFGPTDLYELVQMNKNKGDPVHNPIARLMGFSMADVTPEKLAVANPIAYISPTTAPFLIMHGTSDPVVPIAQSVLLTEALQKARVPVTFEKLNAAHGSGEFSSPATAIRVYQFFKEHLKPQS